MVYSVTEQCSWILSVPGQVFESIGHVDVDFYSGTKVLKMFPVHVT